MPMDKGAIKQAYNEDSLGFFQKIRLVLFRPREFFEKIKGEKGLKAPLFYYLVILVIGTAVSLLVSSFSTIPFTNLGQLGPTKNVYLDALANLMITLLFFFIEVGFIHLFVKLFKGQGNYSDTFRAMTYGITPYFVFALPMAVILVLLNPGLLGIAVFGVAILALLLWSLWLQYKTLSALHKISEWKAFFAMILPIIIIAIIAVAISVIGFSLIWQTRMAETASQAGTSQMNETMSQMAQKIRIDGINGNMLTIRNIGTQSIPSSSLAFYVDNAPKNCDAVSGGGLDAFTLAAGVYKTCYLCDIGTCTASVCPKDKKLKVSAPGNSDEVICP